MVVEQFQQRDSDEAWLPKECWYTKGGQGSPRVMRSVRGTVLHKVSGKVAFPDDPYDLYRIVYEILVPYKVSYNYIIDRDGQIYQLIPDGFQSFHAGKSIFEGKAYCNYDMIGIAMISDGKSFSQPQVKSCVELHQYLMAEHGFGSGKITTHEVVRQAWNEANPTKRAPSRKGDPGMFPIELLERL